MCAKIERKYIPATPQIHCVRYLDLFLLQDPEVIIPAPLVEEGGEDNSQEASGEDEPEPPNIQVSKTQTNFEKENNKKKGQPSCDACQRWYTKI